MALMLLRFPVNAQHHQTWIEITKDKDEDGKPMGLGLSIVGGSDTLLGKN